MEFITRSQWGAKPPKQKPSTFGNVQALFLHHTTGATLGASESDAWMRSIQDYHQNHNGWNDIAYSFLYDSYGRVFEGRGWNVVGAHTIDWNSRAHAFAFLGDGSSELSAAAQDALTWLIQTHDSKYGDKPIKGHREVYGTECPGNWIEAHKNDFRHGVVIQPSPTSPSAPITNNWFEELIAGMETLDFNDLSLKSGLIDNIQGLLNGAQFAPSQCRIDNVAGKQTLGAVKAFQKMKGLKDDGVVGPVTWRALITH